MTTWQGHEINVSQNREFARSVLVGSLVRHRVSGFIFQVLSGNKKPATRSLNFKPGTSSLELETRNENVETPKLLSGSDRIKVDGGISGART